MINEEEEIAAHELELIESRAKVVKINESLQSEETGNV